MHLSWATLQVALALPHGTSHAKWDGDGDLRGTGIAAALPTSAGECSCCLYAIMVGTTFGFVCAEALMSTSDLRVRATFSGISAVWRDARLPYPCTGSIVLHKIVHVCCTRASLA